MLVKNKLPLFFLLLVVGICIECIVLFTIPKKTAQIDGRTPQPTPIPLVKNPSIISGNIYNIQLGNSVIPPKGHFGVLLLAGLLKNVYQSNSKIYADILFLDNANNTIENNKVVLLPNDQTPFLLNLQTTQNPLPSTANVKATTVNFSEAVTVLKQLQNHVLLWNFNPTIVSITTIPQNIKNRPQAVQRAQATQSYGDCNQKFLANLQSNIFAFPTCEIYAGAGNVYVADTK